MKELFIKFLKKHGALRKFKVNIKVYRPGESDISWYIGNIGGAFIWENSAEGHEYWSNLSSLWEEYKKKSAEKTK